MDIVLETERLLLRRWTPADARTLFAFASDPETMRFIGDGSAWVDIARAHQWITRRVADYETVGYSPYAVVERASGRIVGSCGFTYVAALSEIDLGYVFERASWGRGYATEAARAVLAYGFDRLGFEEVTANTVPEHYASRRVLEKIGFEFRGLRRYEGDEEDSAFYVARRRPAHVPARAPEDSPAHAD
ncbi:MAG TPA: GNAT family N-acetyltransferase [Pyrinomonadaceae bacterium]|nr:GNAT family N-acetyltransferase [Pyrinomonadaceae bacterium]